MKNFLRRFLCGTVFVVSLFVNTGCAYAANGLDINDLPFDEDGTIALCDIPGAYMMDYAQRLADFYGYSDYHVNNLVKYENEDCEWSGYVASYEDTTGHMGYMTIDFSQPDGHCVSEFAFDIDGIDAQFEYEGQTSQYFFDSITSDSNRKLTDYMHYGDNPEKPFGFLWRDNESSIFTSDVVRGSIMSGNVLVKKSEMMLTDEDFDETVTKVFLDRYIENPSASLVGQDYILGITDKRYACPFVAAVGLSRQEGLIGGYSDADVFRWLWLKVNPIPHYNYDAWNGNNYDEWTPALKTYMKDYLHFNNDGSVYAIAAGCTAKDFEKAFVGQNTSEHESSWLWTNGGAYGSCCEKFYGWSLLPEHFKNAVDGNKPSIFLYTRKGYEIVMDDAGNEVLQEALSKHAVNVVGYLEAPYYYDVDGERLTGKTIYAAVANGWDDNSHYYMDVTNAKYLNSGLYDTQLQVYTIAR